MKKRTVFFVMVALAALVLTFGCSKAEETAEAGPVTIKVANYALLEAGYESFWNGVKEDFEAANPDITIEWITAPYGEIVNQVINMAGGGDKVDAVYGEIGWVPGLADSGLAAPMTDFFTDEYLEDFYPDVLNAHSIDGDVYGMPLYISPYVLYYNKDLFTKAGLDPENPPTTYDEMLVAAEALSKLTDANGNKVYAFGQTTGSVPVSGSSLTGMIFNFDGTILDAEGNLSVDNEGFKQAFEMVKLLDDNGYNPQNAKLKDLRNLFALGQLAMYYDQSWGFNGIQAINPEAKNFTASAAPLAGGNGSGQSVLQSHCMILVNNGDARVQATAAFIEFLITEDVLGDFMTNITPAYPAKKEMSNMASLLESNVLKGAASAASNVKNQAFIPQLSDLNLELCTLAQAVTVADEDVDTAIAKFKQTMEAKLSN